MTAGPMPAWLFYTPPPSRSTNTLATHPQVVSGLRCIHAAGLACRVLAPSKILVTSKNRIRLNCCGMFDVINFEGINRTAHYQQARACSLVRSSACVRACVRVCAPTICAVASKEYLVHSTSICSP